MNNDVEVKKVKKMEKLPDGAVVAPMQGMILSINVKEGDQVNAGDVIAMIEAMKMRNEIFAPHGGVVKEIFAYDGEIVNNGDILMVVN